METFVPYPPQNPGEFSFISYNIWGVIPVRIVVSKRIDGWCAYMLLKYMPYDYCVGTGLNPSEPISFEKVKEVGDKMFAKYAKELFPEMGEDYAY